MKPTCKICSGVYALHTTSPIHVCPTCKVCPVCASQDLDAQGQNMKGFPAVRCNACDSDWQSAAEYYKDLREAKSRTCTICSKSLGSFTASMAPHLCISHQACPSCTTLVKLKKVHGMLFMATCPGCGQSWMAHEFTKVVKRHAKDVKRKKRAS